MNITLLLIIIKIFYFTEVYKYKVPGTNYSFNHVFEIKDIGDDYFIRYEKKNTELQVINKDTLYRYDINKYLLNKNVLNFSVKVKDEIVLQDIHNSKDLHVISLENNIVNNVKIKEKNFYALKILHNVNKDYTISLFMIDKTVTILNHKYEPIKNIHFDNFVKERYINMYNYANLYLYDEYLIATYQDSIKFYTQEGSKSVIHLGKKLAPHLAYMKNGLLNFIYYDSESHDMYFYELKDFKITNQIIILNNK